MRKRDEPAFPVTLPVSQTGSGLTKLEYTAIQAMQGMLSNANLRHDVNQIEFVPEKSLMFANAVWDDLEKQG